MKYLGDNLLVVSASIDGRNVSSTIVPSILDRSVTSSIQDFDDSPDFIIDTCAAIDGSIKAYSREMSLTGQAAQQVSFKSGKFISQLDTHEIVDALRNFGLKEVDP